MDWLAISTHPLVTTVLKMLLLFFVLLRLSKLKFTANRQADIWRMGLVVLLVLPWLNSFFPVVNIPILPIQISQEIQPANTLYTTLTAINGETALAGVNEKGLLLFKPIFTSIFILLISLISVLLLTKLIRQLTRLRELTHNATPINNKICLSQVHQIAKKLQLQRLPLILQSKYINSPSTWGYRQPVILLPMSMAAAEEKFSDKLQVVLLHEMAHIKRNDWVWLMGAKVTTALFWFNPLLWLIKNKLIFSFEQACDELVLEQHIQPSRYVETLLQFHNQPQKKLFNITTGMAQHSAMYVRLQHILNPRKRSQSMHKNKQKLILLSALTLMFLITVSQLTLAHQPDGTAALDPPNSQHAVKPTAPQIAPSPAKHMTAPKAESHVAPVIHPAHAVAPTVPVIPHTEHIHPSAPVHPAHAPVLAPSPPVEPVVPHIETPKTEKEVQAKLALAETRIKQLETALAQVELRAEQQSRQYVDANNQAQEKRLHDQLQALRSTEAKVMQLESNALQQQERLEANRQQIHAKRLAVQAQGQQAKMAAEKLAQSSQNQQNNQQ